MRYLFNAGPQLTKNELEKMMNQIEINYPKGSEMTMTLAEVLREEGFEEGIEKGKKESLFELAIERLSMKFGVLPSECQEKIATLDLKMLQIFNINIENFKTIEDVKKFLGI